MAAPWLAIERQALLASRQALALGDAAGAESVLRQALAVQPNLPHVHLQLARLRFPGPDYLAWLAWLHAELAPRVYLEIGVEAGRSLRLARPPTRAIGIDPAPLGDPLAGALATTRLYRTTSAQFWRDAPADAGLEAGFDLAFIDGDHSFAAVLDDFMALEARAAPGALIVLHDTVPLDARTAAAERTSGFYSGDGWKLVMALRALRPDLAVATLPVAPTGLTLVGRLAPANTTLHASREAIMAAYESVGAEAVLRRLGGWVALGLTRPEHIVPWLSGVRGQ